MNTLTDCKDDGYVKPFLNTEISKDHEYENPADVAARAGLSRAGSGPRRKNNQLYGDSKKMRVQLPEAPPSPVGINGVAERAPLVITTEKERIVKKRCNPKLMILLILVFLLSAAAVALSLMNMLQKNESCLCSTTRGNRNYVYTFLTTALIY